MRLNGRVSKVGSLASAVLRNHDHRLQAEQGHGHLLSHTSYVIALTMFTGHPSKVKGTQSHLIARRSQ